VAARFSKSINTITYAGTFYSDRVGDIDASWTTLISLLLTRNTRLRGEKLLDELATRQPPLARAVWSIKATAMAETVSWIVVLLTRMLLVKLICRIRSL
jgi:hypothetical protein